MPGIKASGNWCGNAPGPRSSSSPGGMGDIGDFLSGLFGSFVAGEQAQGAMTQAQLDAQYAIQQRQQQSMMTLVCLGVGAYLILRK